MLGSYSVIVPVLNRRGELGATLESIAGSMAFFEANHPRSGEISGEVVVVDEGSTDGSRELVRDAARADFRVRLVEHRRSFGIGPARNTGVRMASGEVLLFCDGDDLFLAEHVFVGFSILEHSASPSGSTADRIRLRVGERGHLALPADRPVAAVRTGVRLQDTILPVWREATRQTIAQCLAVRRECHDWIEGFPESQVYQRIGGCEDGAHAALLATFFRVGLIDLETVEYIRRPGNSFDRQMQRFAHPPGSQFDRLPPAEEPLHRIRRRLEQEKVSYLLDKWELLGPPPLPPGLLNWSGVVDELIQRGRVEGARRVAEQAARAGQSVAEEQRAALELADRDPQGARPDRP
jgi:Glycosyl transferase family 2